MDIATIGFKADVRDLSKADKELKKLARSSDAVDKGNARVTKSSKEVASSFSAIRAAAIRVAAAYAAVKASSFALTEADDFAILQQRIKTATKATGDYVKISKDLYDVSQSTGTSLESNVVLFQQIARSATEIGASNEDVIKLTRALQQLGTIGGSNAVQMSNAMLQFGQSMAGGIVHAQEFSSVVENTPEIAVRMAKGLGMTVGQLRMAVNNGEILSKDVFKSLLGQSEEINTQFQQMPKTLGQAGSVISNTISKALGSVNKGIADWLNTSLKLKGTTREVSTLTSLLSEAIIHYAKKADEALTPVSKIEKLSRQIKDLQDQINRGVSLFGQSYTDILDKQRELNKLQKERKQLIIESTRLRRGNVGLDLQKEYNSILDKQMEKMLDAAIADEHWLDIRYEATKDFIDKQKALRKKAFSGWDMDAGVDMHLTALQKQADAEEKAQQKQKDLLKESQSMVQDYGDTWTRTGNQVVDAIGSMMAAIEKSSNLEMKYTTQLNKMKDAGLDKTKAYKDLEEARAKASVKGSLDMMAASVAMYKEGSDAQKAAHSAYLAMSAIELAMNLKKAISAATLAVINQGSGDPYTAFARIAAMTAMMGGLLSQIGGSISGVGGMSGAVAAQPAPGAGVLGGGTSTSLANTLSYMNDIEASQYTELKNIYNEVVNLNRNITSVVSTLYSTGDLSGLSSNTSVYQKSSVQSGIDSVFKTIGGVTDIPVLQGLTNIVGGVLNSIAIGLGFGGTSRRTSDYGVNIGGTLGSQNVQGYETIQTRRDPGWFQETEVSYRDYQRALSGQSRQAFATVFDNLRKTFIDLGKNLNRDITNRVNNFSIAIGKVSLTGSSEDVQKRLQEAFSGLSDRMAYQLFGGLIAGYRKVNESAFDTLSRLVVDKIATQSILGQTGQKFIGDAIAISESLINIAGGLKELQSAASTYFDKFFTDAQKAAYNQQQLTAALAQQNLTLPKTRQGYKALVESLDLSTTAGQQAYVILMQSADAADQYYSTIEAGVEKLKSALTDTADSILGTVGTISTATQYMTAQAKIFNALDLAKQGVMPTLSSLQSSLDVVKANSPTRYATLADYRRDQITTANALNELAGYTDTQLGVQKSMLDQLTQQTSILRGMTTAASSGTSQGEILVPIAQNSNISNGQLITIMGSLQTELSDIKTQTIKFGNELAGYSKTNADLMERWEAVGLPATRV